MAEQGRGQSKQQGIGLIAPEVPMPCSALQRCRLAVARFALDAKRGTAVLLSFGAKVSAAPAGCHRLITPMIKPRNVGALESSKSVHTTWSLNAESIRKGPSFSLVAV